MATFSSPSSATAHRTFPALNMGSAAATTSTASGGGIGSDNSTLQCSDDVLATPGRPSGLANSSAPLLMSPTKSNRDASLSPGKVVRDEPLADPNSSLATIQMRITRILQRFLVRSPHTFIAMAGIFFPLYYVLGKEKLAYSATTFVGVGGTVYCLTRALFLEVVPHWMLPRTEATRKWRHLMNITYTAFLTVMFTSAVWKLPDLSAGQGLFFLTVSFGVPYIFLAKLYPDWLDKQPSLFQQKYDVPGDNETY